VNNISLSNKLNHIWLMISFGKLRPAATYLHVTVFRLSWRREKKLQSCNLCAVKTSQLQLRWK